MNALCVLAIPCASALIAFSVMCFGLIWCFDLDGVFLFEHIFGSLCVCMHVFNNIMGNIVANVNDKNP